MKNLCLFSAVALLLMSSCGDGTPRIENDLEAGGLRGNVMSVETGSRRVHYNPQGYITQTYSIAKDGAELLVAESDYDESGAVLLESRTYTYYNGSTEPTIDKSVVTPEMRAQIKGAQRGCQYNKDGYTTLRSFYVEHDDPSFKYYNGRPKYVSKYLYNDQNELIELRSTRYGPVIENNTIDGESYVSYGTSVSQYSYNAQDDIGQAITTTDQGKVFTYDYTYEYDQQGNWVSKSANGGKAITRIIKYYPN